MYTGALPTGSNRATYHQDFQLYDDETDEGVDLTGAVITLEVREKDCTSVKLSATTTNGKIVVTDVTNGNFELTFTEDDMRSLATRDQSETYDVGVTIEQSGEVIQYLIGTFPVLDGIVS